VQVYVKMAIIDVMMIHSATVSNVKCEIKHRINLVVGFRSINVVLEHV
jgi:hypothetical protein